ncbi:hypothetical protein SSS_06127 [Sarcoptes scabiei]|uniref:Ig-like domain-containing protein n=1 Tax=Sarcoptes scabiei TaxID=52283 RepID=A0A834RB70_SARSC|nr:hypothetical protein SSS_06127 [Sarcoptes scabiei]
MASDRYKHHHQHHSNAYQQQKQQHHHRSRSHHYYHHRDGRKNFQLLKSYNNNYRLIYTHSKYQDFCSERSKSSVFCLISIVSLPSILFVFLLIPNQFDRIESMWIIDNTTYNVIINGEIALPCNITAPSFDDGVSLVLWYRDDLATPIYTVDARQSISLDRAQHFLHTDIFDQRVQLNLTYPLSFLIIKQIKPSDGGDYRCRVDFRRARTINRVLKLTVIVPTDSVRIYDENFTEITNVAGPFDEDSNQNLICDSSEGNPLPVVHWLKGSKLIDIDYFIVNNTIARNVLTLVNLSRNDLLESFTCQAYNTNLTVPVEKTITLDLFLKPKEIRIISPLLHNNISKAVQSSNLSSKNNTNNNQRRSDAIDAFYFEHNVEKPIELACQCTGSKPSAEIKWKKESPEEWLSSFTQTISLDGLTTTSFLTYVPSIDDNGKNIVCIAYNPRMSSQNSSLQQIWPINLNYVPKLSLVMGSNSLSQDILEGKSICGCVWLEIERRNFQHFTISGLEERNTSLLITNVNHRHYGQYQCYAANSIGQSESESVFLDIKYSPRCKQNNVITIGVALKESVSIECRVIANPSTNLLFEWRFNHQFARNRTDSEIYDKNIEDNLREDYSSVGRDHINHNEMHNNAIIDMPIPDDDHLQHFNEDSSKLDDNHHQLHNNRLDSFNYQQKNQRSLSQPMIFNRFRSVNIEFHHLLLLPHSLRTIMDIFIV